MTKVELEFLYRQTQTRLVPFAAGDTRAMDALPVQSIDVLHHVNFVDANTMDVRAFEVLIVCLDHYRLDYSLRSIRRGSKSGKIKRYDLEVMTRGKWKRKLRWAAEILDARRGSGLIRLKFKIWGEQAFNSENGKRE